MKLFSACLVLLLFIAPVYAAEETHKVAILEFQNKAERIISVNRWTMAEDLAKFLRKKNETIQTAKRKDLLKTVGELSWADSRLTLAQEKAIAGMGVQYLVYGTIAEWRTRGPVNDAYREAAPEATVIFSFDVVDLSSGKVIKNFTTDGRATGRMGRIDTEDPFDTDETKHEESLHDATDMALSKAAHEILKILQLIQ
ncbi:hypothetical protein L0222_12675 [bacterium]|nr:hypothetical protein [bacterium]MCI0606778.1 hypothetical protein [bacterium]